MSQEAIITQSNTSTANNGNKEQQLATARISRRSNLRMLHAKSNEDEHRHTPSVSRLGTGTGRVRAMADSFPALY